MISDPALCRRALREIGEVAAVAVLPDSQISEVEALENIAAIARWMKADTGAQSRDCRDVIVALHHLTRDIEVDRMDDAQVHARFRLVLQAIQNA